ncbi:MAG: carbonic anhydrase [Rhodospirillales bacterium]
MKEVCHLVDGYRRFREKYYAHYRALYESLADKGQTPDTMIISCCDSRVEPAAIFNAKPGELFVIRNVANLVPPYESEGNYHGTSAAIEFAVRGLQVKNIVILGHSRCGGIKAFLDGLCEPGIGGDFIGTWMSIIRPSRADVLRRYGDADPDVLQRAMEHAAIGVSLDNLMTFPFVSERLESRRLQLHGGFFDIASGELFSLDRHNHKFTLVPPDGDINQPGELLR